MAGLDDDHKIFSSKGREIMEVEPLLESLEKPEGLDMSEYSSSKPVDVFRRLHPEEYYKTFLEKESRPDGRKLLQARKVVITPSVVDTKSFGSSLVKIGNTSVICSLDVDIAEPSIENPKHGYIIFHTFLPRMGSPAFRIRAKKNEHKDLISHFLDEQIRPFINLEELCIIEGRLVLQIHVNISLLCFDGNLFDAALYALVSSFLDFRFPEYEVLEEERKVKILKNTSERKLSIPKIPISQTFGLIFKKLILDPTEEEEEIGRSIFSVLYDSNGGLLSIQKPGGDALSDHDLLESLKISKQRLGSILKLLNFVT